MRIAVCDDETVWMEQTKKRLEQIYVSLDLLVDTFSSGKQLLERAKNVSFDLVILDIEMPKMDGLQVAKSLRAMGEETEIVFLTSHVEYALKGYEVQALRYLTKPVDAEKLAKCFLQNSILLDKKNVVLLILAGLVNVIGERWGADCDGFFVAGEMFLLSCCFLRGGRGKLRRLFSAVESFIYFYLNIAFYVVGMYLIYHPNDSEMTFLNTSSWGGVCSFLVLLLIGYTYIYLYRKKITVKLQIRDKITLIVYCLFILSFACMWGVIAEESNMNLPKSFSTLVMFLFTILELFAFIGLIKKKQTDYYKKGQEYQQEYMEMELAHFREYKQAQDETSRVRHDMKNNLACISMLLEEGKNQEAKAYVSQLLGEVNAFSPKVVTGDEMLDAIVASKWSKMEERQISFSLDGVLDQGLNWKPIDICTVFSNGLDNAIEACEKAEGEREISLSLRYTKNFYYMVLSNTMVEAQDTFVIGSRFTTKKNKELHGYGLENMERTIKKYDGTMNILQEENRFILKIMVPLETTF